MVLKSSLQGSGLIASQHHEGHVEFLGEILKSLQKGRKKQAVYLVEKFVHSVVVESGHFVVKICSQTFRESLTLHSGHQSLLRVEHLEQSLLVRPQICLSADYYQFRDLVLGRTKRFTARAVSRVQLNVAQHVHCCLHGASVRHVVTEDDNVYR